MPQMKTETETETETEVFYLVIETTLVGKYLKKLQNSQYLPLLIILDHFGGKRLENVQNNQN